ncbi:EAL domain, c-di-GMP-specific phosphodiesterase class I (or its enzymatically inactive variant) [Marinobacter sp. DSM 26671]|jgi:EAL domain-containing protein (putative c-di-GMP-specific phosphodiesterase class I)|uniref:EAL domain-containing protein n=1 Tax=Marinobacter sp. DSM 26671 TaxID=1761793 RepID=UPI0008E7F41B|nr:bifunctional diguanylate cyclase/phosphodiesterase [Marinobacter sp. DSM 26671]SFD96322.1 EAL domain, c-di-GMP-specific phosphodiesterase class I (or its enzymatically inactive variant) [Marinobacter sp. DSM 26671]
MVSWARSTLFHRLFSHRITFSVFVLTCFLLIVTAANYMEAKDRKDVTLSGIRLASWSLTQLRDEARSFDRQLVLMSTRLAKPEMLYVRYDILWSRFDYLLTSTESYAVRSVNDNVTRIESLFSQFKTLDAVVSRVSNGEYDERSLQLLKADWRALHKDINALVIENMVGGETGNLTEQFDKDLEQLAEMRTVLLILLAAGFVYFVFAILYLRRQFRKDPLTGLANRHYLEKKGSVSEQDLVIVCEIRDFQQVQTEHGGAEADQLIALCAKKLSECISSLDTLIHLSYGVFVIVKRDCRKAPEYVTSEVIACSSFDWEIANTSVPIRFVAGADPGEPDEEVSRPWQIRHQNALRALNHSLLNDHNFCIIDNELLSKFDFRAEVLGELVRFFRGEPTKISLSLVYQPIVQIDKQKTVAGAEVLLRAKLDNETFVPPNVIVDICERHGLGSKFGAWLFQKVGNEASQLFSVLRFQGFLSLNLNPSLINESLPEILKDTIVAAGVEPGHICLEITEDNASLDFDRTIPVIEQCRAMGVSIALDDFGTGYSSLEYLQHLRIDKLKVDRSFVNEIENSPARSQFLKGILDIAHQMGVSTVVEGIENQQQWDIVAEHRASFVQGYFAYKPMELADFLSILVDQLITGDAKAVKSNVSVFPG